MSPSPTQAYDCIVVGAGPAGSTAARELAARNARVLLLDRASFPRDKPCGGGVLISAAAHLPFSLDPVTERVVTGFRVGYKRNETFHHRYDRPLALMTQRIRLDAFLVEQAVAAGATFHDGCRVVGLEPSPDSVTIHLHGGDSLTAPALVAADGANGVVRRSLGLPAFRPAVALEANLDGVPNDWSDSVGLDLGSMPGGYGWLFPKGDHCNIGVGGWPMTGPTLRAELDAYTRSLGFDPAALHGHRGHYLPLRDPDSVLVHGRIAFVGDAAGLVDPLSGEGIGNAIRSGALAAGEIARLLNHDTADLSGYARAVEREIEPDLVVSRQFQAIFHRRPWIFAQLLGRSDRFWQAFCRIIRGDTTYSAFKGRLGPLAFTIDAAAWYARRGQDQRSGWPAA